MIQKLKPFVPLAILVLLVGVVIYLAVMLTVQVKDNQKTVVENRQAITQIANFIQQQGKVASQNQTQ